MKKLPRQFYNRNTIDVALDLLGCRLICTTDGVKTGGVIVEVEAYRGPTDPACHAFHGRTPRNEVMHGPPGFLYVYFTYGNHFMLNVVTERDNFPAAVLLRGIEPLYNIPVMGQRRNTADFTNISSGPGKLAKALNVTRVDNGTDLLKSHIYVQGPSENSLEIMASPRIGIGTNGIERLWRFFIKDNPHVTPANKFTRENSYPLSLARKMKWELPGERLPKAGK
jgi:DNA-3-methyladenine glycosylase